MTSQLLMHDVHAMIIDVAIGAIAMPKRWPFTDSPRLTARLTKDREEKPTPAQNDYRVLNVEP